MDERIWIPISGAEAIVIGSRKGDVVLGGAPVVVRHPDLEPRREPLHFDGPDLDLGHPVRSFTP